MGTAFAARHTQDSPEWYTPLPFIEAARRVMGAIDLDPASHDDCRLHVGAARHFTKEDDGLAQPWEGRIFLNPPGGKDANGKSLMPQFWLKLLFEYGRAESHAARHGQPFEAIWIGYSLEQLQTLQQLRGTPTPLFFPICVPKTRIAFIENEAKRAARLEKLRAEGKSPNTKSQPSHANYITYIGPNSGLFAREFSAFGAVKL